MHPAFLQEKPIILKLFGNPVSARCIPLKKHVTINLFLFFYFTQHPLGGENSSF